MPTKDPATELNETIDRRIAGWPAEVRETDPGRDDALARHNWMQRMEPLAKRIADEDRQQAAESRPRHSAASPPGYVKW